MKTKYSTGLSWTDLDLTTFTTAGQNTSIFGTIAAGSVAIVAGSVAEIRSAIGTYSQALPVDVTGDGVLTFLITTTDGNPQDGVGVGIGVATDPTDMNGSDAKTWVCQSRTKSANPKIYKDVGSTSSNVGAGVITGRLVLRLGNAVLQHGLGEAIDSSGDNVGAAESDAAALQGPQSTLLMVLVATRSSDTTSDGTKTWAGSIKYMFVPDPT